MKMIRSVEITENIIIGNNRPFVLIGGPCVIEDREHCIDMAREIKKICNKLNISYVFKASFDKANRSSIHSYRGVGIEKGFEILKEVKEKVDVPIITDIHEPWHADKVKETVDIIQIPALLCRQTDLLAAAAKTGKTINVKKGQFMSPWEMKNVIEKITTYGNYKIMLTERGTCFGYNNLVVDMRGLVIMRHFAPVVFDATHSVQLPGARGDKSGGQREFVRDLARSAVGLGIDALFMEIHDNPDIALCDGPNMIELNNLFNLLEELKAIDDIIKGGGK
jgi:2-dehydro-3-deoxyphosphooctonate aldolase (KDO 8-P synthase)